MTQLSVNHVVDPFPTTPFSPNAKLNPASPFNGDIGDLAVTVTQIDKGRTTATQAQVGAGTLHPRGGWITLEKALEAAATLTIGDKAPAVGIFENGARFFAHELVQKHVDPGHPDGTRLPPRQGRTWFTPVAFEGNPVGISFPHATGVGGLVALVDGSSSAVLQG